MKRKLELQIPKIYLELNDEHRKIFAEKTLELVFIAAGALIFGQLLSEKEFSLPLAAAGVITVFVGYAIGYYLLRGIEEVNK